jgi:hypothetical protein
LDRAPYRVRIWREHGDAVDTSGDWRRVHEQFPQLSWWKARDLLTDVRRFGRPSGEKEAPAPAERDQDPEPTERGTVVRETGDGLEARHTDTEINARIMNVDDLVEVAGIDLARWEIVSHRVNTWGTVTKNEDGEPTVTRLWQVSATLRPRLVPLVPLDWPPPAVFVTPLDVVEPPPVRRAVIFPDMQVGYRWVGKNTGKPWLEPFHDRAAIDAGLQLLAAVKPDVVLFLGDDTDFQPLSTRWPFGDDARGTTNLAINETRWIYHRAREICPSAHFTKLMGNHEKRWDKFLEERAGELAGLTHADGSRVLSLRRLLGLDDLAIDSVDYPLPFWLWDRIEIEHGRVVRQGGGATAAAILARREHSVVYGHVHRLELAHRQIETPAGRRRVLAGSPGCLCRLDGVVPGSDRPDWQQGMGILSLTAGFDEDLQLLGIQRGRLFLGDRVITGRDYAPELAEVTGATAFLEPARSAA